MLPGALISKSLLKKLIFCHSVVESKIWHRDMESTMIVVPNFDGTEEPLAIKLRHGKLHVRRERFLHSIRDLGIHIISSFKFSHPKSRIPLRNDKIPGFSTSPNAGIHFNSTATVRERFSPKANHQTVPRASTSGFPFTITLSH
jgi:hypothetical protein